MAKTKSTKKSDKEKDLELKYEDPSLKDFEDSIESELEREKRVRKAKPIINKFEKAKAAVNGRSEDLVENMAFYEGQQYKLSKYENQRPWVVRMNTPHATTAIDVRVSSLIAEDYEGHLFPLHPDDKEPLAKLQAVITDEWQRENMSDKINETIKTAAIVREGYTHIIWKDKGDKRFPDNRKGYICAENIENPSQVLIDPSALSLASARYVMVTNRLPLSEVHSRYPEIKGMVKPSGQNQFTERGEDYLGSKDYATSQEDTCTVITYYDYDNKGKVRKVVVVEDIVADEKLLTALTRFPIAQFRWKREANSPYGRALMDDLIMLQKAINAIESAITNTAVAYSAPSYAIRKGAGVNPKLFSELIGAPGYSIMVDGDPNAVFSPLRVPSLDQNVINAKNEFVEFIDRVAGITSPFLGSIGTAGNTAQGARMTMERARIIEADVLSNVTSYVEDLTRIFAEYVKAQYKGQEITTRKVNPSANSVEFDTAELPKEIENIQFAYYINLSNKTRYSKEREKEKLVELYQFEQQYDATVKVVTIRDIVKAYDFEESEEMLTRFDLLQDEVIMQKIQIIRQICDLATELQIDEQLVAQAIKELILDVAEEKQEAMMAFQQQVQQISQQQEQEAQEAAIQAEQHEALVTGQAIPTQEELAMQQQDQDFMSQAQAILGGMNPEEMIGSGDPSQGVAPPQPFEAEQIMM